MGANMFVFIVLPDCSGYGEDPERSKELTKARLEATEVEATVASHACKGFAGSNWSSCYRGLAWTVDEIASSV